MQDWITKMPNNCAIEMMSDTESRLLLEEAGRYLFEEGQTPRVLPVCDHYAGNARFAEKALELQASLAVRGIPTLDITLDMEDGAQVGREAAQREWAAEVINSSANRFQRIGIRVHEVESPFWLDDITVLLNQAGERLAYITLPKLRDTQQLEAVAQVVRTVSQRIGLTRKVPLHALVETHTAIHDVWGMAAHIDVECLSFGLMDFVSAHHGAIPATAMRSPGQFEHLLVLRAKLAISSAALAHGKVASHNVTTEVRRVEVVSEDAQKAHRELGYQRMWSIHPMQIQPIIDAMRLSASDEADAWRILRLARDHQWGPIRDGDTLHDRASYRYYYQLLKAGYSL
jgi:citrate lyase subunit beta / citryl-CoA lyase